MASDTAPAQPRRKIATHVRLYRQVADDLETRILDGEFQIGQRLPTERDLAKEYGVSRTCVREALLALEIAQLVSIRVGSGVFVLGPPPQQQLPEVSVADQHGLSHLLEARMLVEPEICALAATYVTAEDIEKIAKALQKMRDEHRMATETEHGDREFHDLIARATRNPVLQETVGNIWSEMTGPMWQTLQKHIRSPILRLRWIEDHEAILDALKAGDRRRARSAMRQHIKHVTDAFEEAQFL